MEPPATHRLGTEGAGFPGGRTRLTDSNASKPQAAATLARTHTHPFRGVAPVYMSVPALIHTAEHTRLAAV